MAGGGAQCQPQAPGCLLGWRGPRRPKAAASIQAEVPEKPVVPPAPAPASTTYTNAEPVPGALLSTGPEQGGWSLSLEDRRVPGFFTLFQCDLGSWVPSTLGVAFGASAQPGLSLITPLELPFSRCARWQSQFLVRMT